MCRTASRSGNGGLDRRRHRSRPRPGLASLRVLANAVRDGHRRLFEPIPLSCCARRGTSSLRKTWMPSWSPPMPWTIGQYLLGLEVRGQLLVRTAAPRSRRLSPAVPPPYARCRQLGLELPRPGLDVEFISRVGHGRYLRVGSRPPPPALAVVFMVAAGWRRYQRPGWVRIRWNEGSYDANPSSHQTARHELRSQPTLRQHFKDPKPHQLSRPERLNCCSVNGAVSAG